LGREYKSSLQFFVAIKSASTNPKYVYSLLNLQEIPKPYLIPIGLFETYISLSAGTAFLFLFFIYLLYTLSQISALELLRALLPPKRRSEY
jgi:hypothetical protein